MKQCQIAILLIFVGAFNYCLGQISSEYSSKASSCESELTSLKSKQVSIDAEYDKVVAELRQGLFCSLCNRSKSQIEKGGTNFYQHIKDVKGNVVEAPAKAYEQAHKEYLSKFNTWQQEVQNKQKSCENLRTLTQNAVNSEQKQIEQQNQERQRQAQEQYQRQIDQNKQQQEEARQQLEKALQEQQAQHEADKLQLQQKISATVSDYVNSHSADIKERQQSADNISQQGFILAQSIQGNSIDLNKIAPPNISSPSIFSGVPSYEDILKSNSANTNNYFEKYSSLVEDVTRDAIISESRLPEAFRRGYETANTFHNRFNAGADLISGTITEDVVDAYFTINEAANPVITTIQQYTGGVAVKQANTITDLTTKIFEEDFSEKDLDNTFEAMNPLHFSTTFVKEQKPINFRDAAIVVGGGIILSTIGAPIWIGIGAAAWYGFNR